MKHLIFLIGSILLLVLPALAQPPIEEKPEWRHRPSPPLFPPEIVEKELLPRKAIEAIRIARMTEELKLTDEQVQKFFPKLKMLEEAQREFHKNRMRIIKELENTLQNENPSIKKLQEKIDEIQNLEDNFELTKEKFRKELLQILTIEQQARLFVFQEKFENEIREIIREIRREHHPE
ncbi:MAG: hypothetical protein AB1393_04805 [Candidatus Edwardsbacteria bacterium]